MAQLNDDGQWIVMMGFIVSILVLFLAIIVAESALVGKTTSESVLEFPKTDIQDLRTVVFQLRWENLTSDPPNDEYKNDISTLYLNRKNAIVDYTGDPVNKRISIHYNNGITSFNEVYEELF